MANAALISNVATDRGMIVVDLQYAKAPQAVANFITLAQGTRNRLNPKTGAVTDSPLYIGEKFFRVVNDPTFKIIQSGSGSGDNTGRPGFVFRDKFDPTLTHVPYVLSMANAGTNTNGSQIFFTGNTAIPSLNNVHTVFGLVTDSSSRAVIDAILTAGNNGTTITGVTFSRTDAGAVAFNELAQNLPEVSSMNGSLKVVKGTSVTWLPAAPIVARNQIRVFRSQNLQTWTDAGSSYIGNNFTPVTSAMIDNGTLAKAFYHISSIRFPDDATKPILTAADLIADLPEAGLTVSYDFNAQGSGGTITVSGDGPAESGTFTLIERTVAPYKLVITVDNGSTLTPRYLRYTTHSDTFGTGQMTGRLLVEQFNGLFWTSLTTGTHTLSN